MEKKHIKFRISVHPSGKNTLMYKKNSDKTFTDCYDEDLVGNDDINTFTIALENKKKEWEEQGYLVLEDV